MKTGQCRYLIPWAWSRRARSAVSRGSVVVWSIRIASAESPERAAAMTSSTTASSRSTRWTLDASRTASAGVAAAFTPNGARARTLSGVRFHAVTASPRLAAASANAPPSNPVPRNAMFAMVVVLEGLRAPGVAGEGGDGNEAEAASYPEASGDVRTRCFGR